MASGQGRASAGPRGPGAQGREAHASDALVTMDARRERDFSDAATERLDERSSASRPVALKSSIPRETPPGSVGSLPRQPFAIGI